MVHKTCSWGLCKSASRRQHDDDMKGVTFRRFPQPKTQRERCMEWIKRCNRPHTQLNVDKVGYYHFVCSKHFIDGADDPVSASVGGKTPVARKRRSKIDISLQDGGTSSKQLHEDTFTDKMDASFIPEETFTELAQRVVDLELEGGNLCHGYRNLLTSLHKWLPQDTPYMKQHSDIQYNVRSVSICLRDLSHQLKALLVSLHKIFKAKTETSLTSHTDRDTSLWQGGLSGQDTSSSGPYIVSVHSLSEEIHEGDSLDEETESCPSPEDSNHSSPGVHCTSPDPDQTPRLEPLREMSKKVETNYLFELKISKPEASISEEIIIPRVARRIEGKSERVNIVHKLSDEKNANSAHKLLDEKNTNNAHKLSDVKNVNSALKLLNEKNMNSAHKLSGEKKTNSAQKLSDVKDTNVKNANVKSKVKLKRHPCQICGKEFHLIYLLKRHEENHSKPEKDRKSEKVEKSYACSFCKKAYSRPSDLENHTRNHTRNHTGERPFRCDVCGMGFMKKGTFTTHTKLHSVVKPFACGLCSMAFYSKFEYERHQRTHMGAKHFVCDVCGKTFSERRYVLQHKMTHTGEKLYICEICGKAFSRNGSLTKHKKVHLGEKDRSYFCKECGKTFRNWHNHYKHKTAIRHQNILTKQKKILKKRRKDQAFSSPVKS